MKRSRCKNDVGSLKSKFINEFFSAIYASFKIIISSTLFFNKFICSRRRIFLIKVTQQSKTILFFVLQSFSCATSASRILWRSLDFSVLNFFHSFLITRTLQCWLRWRYSLQLSKQRYILRILEWQRQVEQNFIILLFLESIKSVNKRRRVVLVRIWCLSMINIWSEQTSKPRYISFGTKLAEKKK